MNNKYKGVYTLIISRIIQGFAWCILIMGICLSIGLVAMKLIPAIFVGLYILSSVFSWSIVYGFSIIVKYCSINNKVS